LPSPDFITSPGHRFITIKEKVKGERVAKMESGPIPEVRTSQKNLADLEVL
jgi:hypothetical protein